MQCAVSDNIPTHTKEGFSRFQEGWWEIKGGGEVSFKVICENCVWGINNKIIMNIYDKFINK